MVIMENCHRYDNGAVDAVVNSTLVVCSWHPSPPELHLRTAGSNGTVDRCLVSAVCAAERAGYAVAIPVVCCVGILLNVVNLTILLQTNRFPESSYTYLSALAVADLLSLLFFGVNGVGRGFYDGHRGWRAFEVYAYFPLGSSSTTASVFLTVTVTVERYAFIYHPLRSKAWCHRSVARRVVAAVALGSVAVNVPRFFAMRVGGSGQLEFTGFGLGAYYSSIVWIYFSVISVGSCVCLVVFNTLLIVGIHRTHRKRRALVGGGGGSAANNKSRDEVTLTRTLVIVVCVFMAGELPSSFTSRSFFVALVGRKDHELLSAPGYRVAVLVSTGLVVAQHSLNFVVYCVFNRRFCAVLRHRLASVIFCNRPDLSPQPPDPKIEPPPPPPPPEADCNDGPCPFVPAKADV